MILEDGRRKMEDGGRGRLLALRTTVFHLPSSIFLVLFAFALRVLGLGSRGLWLDEATSWAYAQDSLTPALQAQMELDPHPPLFYLLLRLWTQLGDSETLLRWPSALAGVLAVALVYHLGRAWRGPHTGLAAALLLAVSPLAVWYSQEARMYSLVALWGLLSVACLGAFLRRGQPLAGAGYALFSLVGLYTHYSMLLVLLGQALYVAVAASALRRRRRVLPGWLLAQAVVVAGFVPWLPVALGHARTIGSGNLHLFTRLEQWAASRGLAMPALPSTTADLLLPAAISIVLLVLLALLVRRHSWSAATIAGAAALVYLLLTAASALPQGASLKRQTLVLLPYLVLGIGAGLDRLPSRRLWLALGLVTAMCLAATYRQPKEGWRDLASMVEADGGSEDVVLLHADYTQVAFAYYYHGPARAVAAPMSETEIDKLVQPYARVWLVLSHQEYVDPDGQVQQWIERRLVPVGRASLEGIEVWVYQRSP